MVCAKAATLIGDAAGKVGTGGGGGRGGADHAISYGARRGTTRTVNSTDTSAGSTGRASTRGAIGILGGASAGVESTICPRGWGHGERILGQVRRRLHSRQLRV